MDNNKKILILEDNVNHYRTIKEGVLLSEFEFEFHEVNLSDFIKEIKNDNAISVIPTNIDLFIIDVILEKGHDELGLKFLLELKSKYKNSFKYIVVSNWDKSEFETEIEIDNNSFIDRNNYNGFELEFKIRNTINNLDL